ncbi:palmitoyltransferase akr1 isoform X3 [Carcharodon carcharias]|uniref:palmitoyltransferase akr1 isoform X3 n=1 Tax=Carcharodon carcharias TaxID=13397 RepID=UPI001B7E9357|nr:palmitoyltransferase akr1 isoform X3 [Carcharodon carcharias]
MLPAASLSHWAASGSAAFAEALRWGDLQQCARWLQQDRAVLGARGWHGFTPLHHAAYRGHRALSYLLLEHGADSNIPNDAGETPFHFACRRGELCIMHQMVKNGANVTALDHQGKTALHQAVSGGSIHQEVTKLLNKYSKEQQRGKPKQPTGLYYGCLLLPGVLSSIVFLIASYLGKYGGAFSVVAFAILARMVFFQYHRISHLARLPNPMYVGTFAAGIFHSLYCFYYKILPVLWPDKLLLWCMTMLATTLLWMFKELLTRDPGNLQKSGCEAEYSTVTQLIEANQNPSRFCIYCEVIQPEQTKHCRLCNTCMVNFDHHCLFLMKCVARDNQRLFVLFLLEVFVCHLTFTASALYCLNLRYGLNLEVAQSVLSLESWVVGLALMNLATAVWELMVLKDQLVTISTNSTTTFTHRPNATAYSWGRRLKNVTTFLLTGIRLQSSQRNFSSQF